MLRAGSANTGFRDSIKGMNDDMENVRNFILKRKTKKRKIKDSSEKMCLVGECKASYLD